MSVGDLDAEDIEMFFATASGYQGQAGELSQAAEATRQASPVTPGGINGRTQMANDINSALITAGDKMDQASQGITAYAGATSRIGNQYQSTKDISTQLLGSVLNASGRADQATDPGGH